MAVSVNEELLAEAEQLDNVQPPGVYLEGEPIPPDRVLLFEVNGKQYTAPKRVDHRIVFRYLKAVRQGDSDTSAIAHLMYDLLGEAVMDALATEELDEKEFQTVMKVVERHTMGAMEKTLGNSQSGRGR